MGNGPLDPFQILQTLRRAPGQQPTLQQTQQPTPQDYADALEAYGRQPIRTPGALASNLAADAINRLAARNAQTAQNGGSIAGGQSAAPMEFNLPTSIDPRSVGLSQPPPPPVGPFPPIGPGQ